MGCGQTTDKGTVHSKPVNAAATSNPFPLAPEAGDPGSPANRSISQRDTNVPPGRTTIEGEREGRARKEDSSVNLLS